MIIFHNNIEIRNPINWAAFESNPATVCNYGIIINGLV